MKKTVFILFMLLLCSAVNTIADDDKVVPAKTITKAEVRDHLFYIASDELEGRGTGSAGFKIAQQYAVTNFRQAGLKPIIKDKDGKLSWYQEVPLVRTRAGEGNSLVIAGRTMTFAKDYILNNARDTSSCSLEAELVFGGYGISEFEMGYDDLGELDVNGKIVVLLAGGPRENGVSTLPENVAALYDGRKAVSRKIENMERAGAKAVVILADERTAKYWDRIAPRATGEAVSLRTDAAAKQIPAITAGPALKQKILGDNPSTQARELGLKARLVVDVASEEFSCRNVVAYLPGTDEALKDEYVTVGAHYDHLGIKDGVIYNGANDNGSGSVAVLEIAEAIAMAPAKRPIIFLLYTGEELGLLGSRYFVANPPVPLENIKVNVNYEMIARGSKTKAGETIVSNITDNQCPEIEEFAKAVQARTEKLIFSGRKYFGGSDHHAFYSKGIPILCFVVGKAEGGGPSDYHRPEDDAEKANFDCMTEAIRFTCNVILDIANAEAIPAGK